MESDRRCPCGWSKKITSRDSPRCEHFTVPAASGWLFHIDARNVVASHWEPVVEEPRVVGFRTRLIETEGRAGRALLRTFRPVAAARQTDFLGHTLAELPVDSEGVRLDFTCYEWVQVEARWKDSF